VLKRAPPSLVAPNAKPANNTPASKERRQTVKDFTTEDTENSQPQLADAGRVPIAGEGNRRNPRRLRWGEIRETDS
jgi:hypothetical protein